VSGNFANNQTIAFAGSQKYMRIKPLYNGATINVTGSSLASQLYLIQSHAASTDARTDISVTRTLDAPSSVFDFAIFSNTTIIQN
jgi:hypothetical protein